MKAIQVVKPGQIEIIEKDMPEIKRGNEVLVKVRMVGICGSDMHIYHGTNPMATYPRIIGHEVAGEIVEIGADVKNVAPGDKIVLEPIQTCGECYACRKGRNNVCEKLNVYGVHIDGGYQEYLVLPENNVHKVSGQLDWQEAVLVEPFTIGAQANWRGDVREGDIVFIMGAGPIGLSVLKIAKLKGAVCIISDLSDDKLAYAKEQGADYVINAMKDDVKEEINRITGGYGANVTIDAVCTTKTFEDCIALTSAAGRVVTLGFNEEPSQIPQLPITGKELTIVGSRLQSNKFPEVIALFNEGKIQAGSFVTHQFRLEDIHKAIEQIETEPDKVRKVVLEVN
ncbi:zinc-binding alcohol dehydrogenase family protein [Scopulibacillus cellulosilyticus]|uniref:Zinc-binding alcohol dehydrogenase family protein n=1 Tax=Scopulibacillus cellulosilyticus TaxID=2665665 RepID=A0ABW2PUX6_9BACL